MEVRHEGSLSEPVPTVGSWGLIPLGTSESQCSQEGAELGCVYTCSTGHYLRLPLTTLSPAWFFQLLLMLIAECGDVYPMLGFLSALGCRLHGGKAWSPSLLSLKHLEWS